MARQWILAALVVAPLFIAGKLLVRRAINRVDGPRVEASIYYFASSAVMFFCLAIAALFSAVPVWLGVLGFAMAVLAVAGAESSVRYGNGKHVRQVMRRWLRTPERSRYR
jgi:hypothetical protein